VNTLERASLKLELRSRITHFTHFQQDEKSTLALDVLEADTQRYMPWQPTDALTVLI
jgi:hypothetical protein